MAAHAHAIKVDIRAVGIELDTGVARRRQNAAPIGIGAGQRRLDQRRERDRTRNGIGLLFRARLLDANLRDLFRAFAIAHQRHRQLLSRCHQGVEEFFRRRALLPDGAPAGHAVRHQEHGIVGGGVAIHRDAVEAQFARTRRGSLQELRFHNGVGE